MEKVKTYLELPYDYWNLVCEHLPNYYRRDDVLKSAILIRYVTGEEVSEEDLDWLPEDKDEADRMHEELDLQLYNEAVEAYNEKMKSYSYRHYLFAQEVENKLYEVLDGKEVDLTEQNYYAAITERHCGETFKDTVTLISEHGFKTSEYSEQWFRYSEMSLADLCIILDYLITNKW